MVKLDYRGELALGIYNESGEQIAVTSSNKAIIGGFDIIYYPEELVANEELVTLADGNYVIRLVSRQQDYDNWVRVAADGINISVSGNEIKVVEPVTPTAVISCEKFETLTEQVNVGGTADFQVTLKNDSGYDFIGEMSLLVYNDDTNKKVFKSSVDVLVGKNSEQVVSASLRLLNSMTAGRYRVEVENFTASNNVELDFTGGETVAYVEVVDPSGVASVGGDNVSVSVRGNVIHIDGTAEEAAVYDLSGVCICTTADREIPMDASGVYFVKVAGKVWKVLVR